MLTISDSLAASTTTAGRDDMSPNQLVTMVSGMARILPIVTDVLRTFRGNSNPPIPTNGTKLATLRMEGHVTDEGHAFHGVYLAGSPLVGDFDYNGVWAVGARQGWGQVRQ